MELKSEEEDYAAITEEPATDFHSLAPAALDNAGINTVAQLCSVRDLAGAMAAIPQNPTVALVEAKEDKIVYKITFF